VRLVCDAGFAGSVLDSLLGECVQTSFMDMVTGQVACVVPAGGVELCGDGATYEAWLRAGGNHEKGGEDGRAKAVAALLSSKGVAPVGTGVAAVVRGEPTTAGRWWLRVSGVDVLSNEAVNMVSSTATGVLAAAAWVWMWA